MIKNSNTISQSKKKSRLTKKTIIIQEEPATRSIPAVAAAVETDRWQHKWSWLLGLALLFILCVCLTLIFLRNSQQLTTPSNQPIQSAAPTSIPPEPLKELNFLLLGFGGRNHDGGSLSDTIMIVRIDLLQKYIALISVPRDLWVPLRLKMNDAPTWGKINSAYSIGNDTKGYLNRDEQFTGSNGGGTLAKTTVAEITGLQIDYYAAVDFDAFTKAIDTIGPLTITVPYAFDDPLYPIRGEEKNLCNFTESDLATLSATFKNAELTKQFTCRYELLHFDKGKTLMDGETALKFVRSRHGNVGGNDFGRAQRQQAVIEAIKQKVFSLSFIPRIIPLAQQLFESVQTDISLNDIPLFLNTIGDISQYTMHSIMLTDVNVLKNSTSSDRQFILIPREGLGNWSGVQYYIKEELKNASEAAQLTASSSAERAN